MNYVPYTPRRKAPSPPSKAKLAADLGLDGKNNSEVTVSSNSDSIEDHSETLDTTVREICKLKSTPVMVQDENHLKTSSKDKIPQISSISVKTKTANSNAVIPGFPSEIINSSDHVCNAGHENILSNSDYFLCGYLGKLSPHQKSMSQFFTKAGKNLVKQRWMVLSERLCKLFYYKSKGDTEIIGEINIAGATFNYEPEEPDGLFSIISDGQTYHLAAGDDASRQRWLDGLQEAKLHYISTSQESVSPSSRIQWYTDLPSTPPLNTHANNFANLLQNTSYRLGNTLKNSSKYSFLLKPAHLPLTASAGTTPTDHSPESPKQLLDFLRAVPSAPSLARQFGRDRERRSLPRNYSHQHVRNVRSAPSNPTRVAQRPCRPTSIHISSMIDKINNNCDTEDSSNICTDSSNTTDATATSANNSCNNGNKIFDYHELSGSLTENVASQYNRNLTISTTSTGTNLPVHSSPTNPDASSPPMKPATSLTKFAHSVYSPGSDHSPGGSQKCDESPVCYSATAAPPRGGPGTAGAPPQRKTSKARSPGAESMAGLKQIGAELKASLTRYSISGGRNKRGSSSSISEDSSNCLGDPTCGSCRQLQHCLDQSEDRLDSRTSELAAAKDGIALLQQDLAQLHRQQQTRIRLDEKELTDGYMLEILREKDQSLVTYEQSDCLQKNVIAELEQDKQQLTEQLELMTTLVKAKDNAVRSISDELEDFKGRYSRSSAANPLKCQHHIAVSYPQNLPHPWYGALPRPFYKEVTSTVPVHCTGTDAVSGDGFGARDPPNSYQGNVAEAATIAAAQGRRHSTPAVEVASSRYPVREVVGTVEALAAASVGKDIAALHRDVRHALVASTVDMWQEPTIVTSAVDTTIISRYPQPTVVSEAETTTQLRGQPKSCSTNNSGTSFNNETSCTSLPIETSANDASRAVTNGTEHPSSHTMSSFYIGDRLTRDSIINKEAEVQTTSNFYFSNDNSSNLAVDNEVLTPFRTRIDRNYLNKPVISYSKNSNLLSFNISGIVPDEDNFTKITSSSTAVATDDSSDTTVSRLMPSMPAVEEEGYQSSWQSSKPLSNMPSYERHPAVEPSYNDHHLDALQALHLAKRDRDRFLESYVAYKTQSAFLHKQIVEMSQASDLMKQREERLKYECSVWEAQFDCVRSKYLVLLNDLHSPPSQQHDRDTLARMLSDALHHSPVIRAMCCNGRSYDVHGFCTSASDEDSLQRCAAFLSRQAQAVVMEEHEEVKQTETAWEAVLAGVAAAREPSLQLPDLKHLIRERGVPLHYRPKVWLLLLERSPVGALRRQLPGTYYEDLLARCIIRPLDGQDCSEVDIKTKKQIELDLLRTLPNNRYYENEFAENIIRLRRVLLAFAVHNKEIAYCQGLNRLAAIALLFLPEVDAFWCLVCIVEHLMPEAYFTPKLLGPQIDQRVLLVLIAEKLPQLHAHLQKHRIDISMITFNWFLCLFVEEVPHAIYLHIWDSFLLEGAKVMFRYTLAMLKLCEEGILARYEFMDVSNYLRSVPPSLADIGKLRQTAFQWANPLRRRQLKRLRLLHKEEVLAEVAEQEVLRKQYQLKAAASGPTAAQLLQQDEEEGE